MAEGVESIPAKSAVIRSRNGFGGSGTRKAVSKVAVCIIERKQATNRPNRTNRTIRATIFSVRTLTANAAKTQFGQLIDMAQREPVRLTRRDRVVGVLVSAQDYEAMREFYANRLQHSLAASTAFAEQAGMTEPLLEDLLRDES